jgi:hypothetical protein
MDLHIGIIIGINSSPLEVVCPPPEIGVEKSGEILRTGFEVTHVAAGSVALKCAVMDLHTGTTASINSPPLEVACPPQGIGAKI